MGLYSGLLGHVPGGGSIQEFGYKVPIAGPLLYGNPGDAEAKAGIAQAQARLQQDRAKYADLMQQGTARAMQFYAPSVNMLSQMFPGMMPGADQYFANMPGTGQPGPQQGAQPPAQPAGPPSGSGWGRMGMPPMAGGGQPKPGGR